MFNILFYCMREALISGGGQERGLRSGTLAPSLCVGMGEAARLCMQDMDFDKQWIEHLSDRLKRYDYIWT